MARTILIIDDENNMRWVLNRALEKAGYDAITASHGDEGLRLFARHAVDLVLLDLKMPGMDGLSVLREIRQRSGQIPILLLTAYASVSTAVEALKLGATDYVRKPFDLEELLTKISDTLQVKSAPSMSSAKGSSSAHPIFIGTSSALAKLYNVVEAASTSEYPVLICGEAGSGRRTLARLIHRRTNTRADGNMVVIDCDSLPQSILWNELKTLLCEVKEREFQPPVGHREQWEQALGGTLVVANWDKLPSDWIRNFSYNVQRYLRSPRRPHGLRLILTAQEKENGSCHEFASLLIEMNIPPLRRRSEDIPLLIAHFAPDLKWTTKALAALNAYDWPGNVAELKQTVSYAAILADDGEVDLCHLPSTNHKFQKSGLTSPTARQFELPEEGIDLDHVEKSLIEQALVRTEGNKAQAARLLSISRSTLLYRLEKHGLIKSSVK